MSEMVASSGEVSSSREVVGTYNMMANHQNLVVIIGIVVLLKKDVLT